MQYPPGRIAIPGPGLTAILVAGLLTAVAVVSTAQEQQDFSFRRTRWRMTEEEVRQAEPGEPIKVIGSQVHRVMTYKDKLAGHECYFVYTFADGLLVRAKYLIGEQHSDPQQYLQDFAGLRRHLSQGLGEPIESAEWRDNHLRGTPELWGEAVTSGHLVLDATWDRGATHVIATLSGGNSHATIEIEYFYRFKKGE